MSRAVTLAFVLLTCSTLFADDVTKLLPPVTSEQGLEQIGSSDLSGGGGNFGMGETRQRTASSGPA